MLMLINLLYIALETDKAKALQQSNGNYDASVRLSNEAKKELCWWITNVMSSFQHIHVPDPDIIIYADSGERWKVEEINHMNVLELKAIFIGVQTYWKGKNSKHVRVMSGNTTAVSDVNNKGGIKSEFCNEIAKELWVWCTSQNIWISAAHFTGKQNTEYVRKPNTRSFCLRINHQIDRYISWKPDPKARSIDDFSIKWNTEFYYIFPPFSLLGKETAKIYRDKTKAIAVIPKWLT